MSGSSAPRLTPGLQVLQQMGRELIDPITLSFGNDSNTIALQQDFLTENFAYFRSALRNGPTDQPSFTEGAHRRVHFHDLTAETVARIVPFIWGNVFAFSDCRELGQFLDAIVAADYLCLVEKRHKDLLYHIRRCLVRFLPNNRDQISSDHLELVSHHPGFRPPTSRSENSIWQLLVRAGARPYAQQYLLGRDITGFPGKELGQDELERASEGSVPVWRSTLEHFRRLFQGNEDYRQAVAEAVRGAHVRRTAKHLGTSVGDEGVMDPLYYYHDPDQQGSGNLEDKDCFFRFKQCDDWIGVPVLEVTGTAQT